MWWEQSAPSRLSFLRELHVPVYAISALRCPLKVRFHTIRTISTLIPVHLLPVGGQRPKYVASDMVLQLLMDVTRPVPTHASPAS